MKWFLPRALALPKVSAALREGVAAERNAGESAVSVALFTGVTRGMEFSEICRFGASQSPAYVTRTCATTQTANATRRALTTIIEMASSVVTQRSFG